MQARMFAQHPPLGESEAVHRNSTNHKISHGLQGSDTKDRCILFVLSYLATTFFPYYLCCKSSKACSWSSMFFWIIILLKISKSSAAQTCKKIWGCVVTEKKWNVASLFFPSLPARKERGETETWFSLKPRHRLPRTARARSRCPPCKSPA